MTNTAVPTRTKRPQTVFGGEVEMPLAETEWAEQYGMCADRYGVRWMVNYTGDAQLPAIQERGS